MKHILKTAITFTLKNIFPEIDETTIYIGSGLLIEAIYFAWNKAKTKKKQTAVK